MIRVLGGRKTVPRQDNGGLWDPEKCPEDQARQCNLSGRFILFIPGIRSISAFDLPTNSFYAMQAAIEKFQTIAFIRGGRISGFLDGQRTPFFIGKRLVDVSRIDDEGRPNRVAQWLIELEAPVDPRALLRHDEGIDAVEQRATPAATVLQGAADTAASEEDGVIDLVPAEPALPGQDMQAATRQGECAAPSPPAAPERPTAAPAKPSAGKPASDETGGADKEVAWLIEAAASLGIDAGTYERYAARRWGQGWKKAAGGRKRALEDVTPLLDDARGFVENVRGELGVWA